VRVPGAPPAPSRTALADAHAPVSRSYDQLPLSVPQPQRSRPRQPALPCAAAQEPVREAQRARCAIGNLTSQFWGNVYLNDLDHFVKRTLKCQHYLRYVDDMVLLAPDREALEQWGAAIDTFLRERLHLTLRPELTTPFPVRQGIDFV